MIVPEETIFKALDLAIERIIQRYDDLDMRATGETAESLEARATTNRGEIWGSKVFEYLSKGRPPSDRLPPVDAIYNWMLNKPSFTGSKTRSVAFAIAKTIQSEGTSWYKKGGSDVLEVVQSDEMLREFQQILGEEIRVLITDQFIRDLKEVK